MRKRHYFFNHIVLSLAVLLGLLFFSVSSCLGDGNLNPAEKWIKSNLQTGDTLDLEVIYGRPEQRKISAQFVHDIITDTTGKYACHYRGVRIKNAIIDGPLILHSADVKKFTALIDCQFSDKVDLSRSHFHKDLSFEGSTFYNSTYFQRLTIDGSACFVNSKFCFPVDFSYSRIGMNFEMDSAWISVNDILNWNYCCDSIRSLESGDRSLLEYSLTRLNLYDALDSSMTMITKMARRCALYKPVPKADADDSTSSLSEYVSHAKKATTFHRLTTGANATFKNATIAGDVTFSFADISGTLEFDDACFYDNPDSGISRVNFAGTAVEGSVWLVGAKFENEMRLVYMDIGYNLRAANVRGCNRNAIFECDYLCVHHNAYFDSSLFLGELSLSNAYIDKQLKFNSGRLYGTLNLSGIEVSGGVSFDSTSIYSTVDLVNGRVNSLSFRNTKWGGEAVRNDTINLKMKGACFNDFIVATSSDTDFGAAIELLNSTPFSVSAYSSFEWSLAGQGRQSESDEVYIRKRQKERNNMNLFSWAYVYNYILDLSIGYGRRPDKALIGSLIIVMIGTFIYGKKDSMECLEGHRRDTKYNSFIYSLDLFLPVVELGTNKVWRPKWRPNNKKCCHLSWWLCRLQYYYRPLHILLGWLMITLGLAALTGIVS